MTVSGSSKGLPLDPEEVIQDEVVCSCAQLFRSDLKRVLSENYAITFNEFLDQTGAGKKCTACLLDVEFIFSEGFDESTWVNRFEHRMGYNETKLKWRRKLFRLIDQVSPNVCQRLTEVIPVFAGNGIIENVWVANSKRGFEIGDRLVDVHIDFKIRDADGEMRHKTRLSAPPGEAICFEASQFIGDKDRETELVAGSLEISRQWSSDALRGASRPHFEVVSTGSVCSVHSQAANSPGISYFGCWHRPGEDRLIFAIINYEQRFLTALFEFFSSDNSPLEHKTSVHVPPMGTGLYEMDLPIDVSNQMAGQPIKIKWQTDRSSHLYLLCGSKDLSTLSIDHV